ncbi:YezD family protein [Gottschalkia acidurici]
MLEKESSEESLSKLGKIINTVKYGSVTAIIQEGKIVQIERNEKVRVK